MDKVRLFPSWNDTVIISERKQDDVCSMVRTGGTTLPTSFFSADIAPGHVSSFEQKWSYYFGSESHADGTYTLENGKIIDVTTVPTINPSLIDNNETLQYARKLAKSYPDIIDCGGKIPGRVIGGKNSLVPLIIQMVMNKKNKTHIPFIYDIVKVNSGYRIYSQGSSNPTWGSMGYHCNKDIVKSIIRQLASICFSQRQYGFSHGYPVISNLSFDNEACSYEVEGHHIEGMFTVKYKGFDNSSATFNGNHYCIDTAKVRAFQSYVEENPFQRISNTNSLCEKRCGGTSLTYKLNSQTSEIYEVIRHGGIAMYSSSYDFYSFFTSLMLQADFRDTVFDDPELRSVWDNIWIDNESLTFMNNRIMLGITNGILTNVNLRCDVAEHVLFLTD